MNKYYIIGAGGHTRSLLALINHQKNINISGIYDDSYKSESYEVISDAKVKGSISDLPDDGYVIISYGNLNKREEMFHKYLPVICKANLIHPSSVIEQNVNIGIANQIFANTFINAFVSIGNNNIINSGCIIEHETKIGSNCHISIGSILGGRVSVGDKVFIGAGATVIDKINICDKVTIGANSTVISDIAEPGTYVGTPARRIK